MEENKKSINEEELKSVNGGQAEFISKEIVFAEPAKATPRDRKPCPYKYEPEKPYIPPFIPTGKEK